MKRNVFLLGMCISLFCCKPNEEKTTDMTEQQPAAKSIGSLEKIDPEFNNLISDSAKIEIVAEGYDWSEGPLWIKEKNMLLFSDVPKNTVYKWTADKGAEVFLQPSGYTGSGHYSGEPGANGLTLSNDGKLVLCQHGDRRVAQLDASFDAPESKFITLSDNYKGKKLNSPNDVVFRSNGDLFFTDPPYGLPQQENDSSREIPFQGVYKVSKGKTSLVTDSLTRPNGLAFLKGEKTLLVANSDPEKATWYAFDFDAKDNVTNARIFHDATPLSKAGDKGLPDGLRVDGNGNVFATGPGGIWVFNASGKLLGKIRITEPTSNCALADDDKTLYITADMYLVRVRLRD
jgi:gluconolactonase